MTSPPCPTPASQPRHIALPPLTCNRLDTRSTRDANDTTVPSHGPAPIRDGSTSSHLAAMYIPTHQRYMNAPLSSLRNLDSPASLRRTNRAPPPGDDLYFPPDSDATFTPLQDAALPHFHRSGARTPRRRLHGTPIGSIQCRYR